MNYPVNIAKSLAKSNLKNIYEQLLLLLVIPIMVFVVTEFQIPLYKKQANKFHTFCFSNYYLLRCNVRTRLPPVSAVINFL